MKIKLLIYVTVKASVFCELLEVGLLIYFSGHMVNIVAVCECVIQRFEHKIYALVITL